MRNVQIKNTLLTKMQFTENKALLQKISRVANYPVFQGSSLMPDLKWSHYQVDLFLSCVG
ncbi:hypothetical protein C7H79_14175 [Nitrosomonas supralitoralis]|uniref:Uncharacterized protein n=1 Tax=Nitrosomonas supralitoralis TaxID=2116706 RepID=A0A2P7NS91_9PROT|nr:hypothetical protein C7H79_14175 [Nitrosomonas supralitoralis]